MLPQQHILKGNDAALLDETKRGRYLVENREGPEKETKPDFPPSGSFK